ncbi:uncharacterized protein DNG_00641 [Cephalotrichum gorgonifer]|uniref:Uncharacterized protein n=1 Tax=Cephalotrichum gorgonifer TaxID=2041049 RepID=A0AAE8MP43_9PEZI|nr:uncharacterized protein DNG_00641 [Cephalotrichum gorgonifer]
MSLGDPAIFDPNIWYQLSEARVDVGGKDLKHNLVITDSPAGFGVLPDDNNYWQFVPTGDGIENRYFLRSQKTGTGFQLATCWDAEEIHPAKTRLCLPPTDDNADAQMWESYKWDDGTTGIRFINVKNGTKWWLDVHKGNPPYMNDDINTQVFNPAQRWLVSSVSAVAETSFHVDDATTTKPVGPSSPTNVETAPTDDAGSGEDGGSQSLPRHGLSAGVSAGIGVGVAGAIIALVAIIFFVLRRRRQKQIKGEEAAAAAITDYQNGIHEKQAAAALPVEAPTPDTGASEFQGSTPTPEHRGKGLAELPGNNFSPQSPASRTQPYNPGPSLPPHSPSESSYAESHRDRYV